MLKGLQVPRKLKNRWPSQICDIPVNFEMFMNFIIIILFYAKRQQSNTNVHNKMHNKKAQNTQNIIQK